MNVVLRRRRAGGLLVLLLALGLTACSEDLETSAGCPALCSQDVPVRDTIIDPFSLDTAVAGYPLVGSEPVMLLATRGDTVDTRVVLRFDSLTTTFSPTAADTARPLTQLDSAYVRLHFDPLGALRRGTLTIQAYDIDTTDAATTTATQLALFRGDRLLGSVTMPGELVVDSVRVHLDTARVMAKIRAGTRLRIGLRVTGSQSAQLRLYSREGLGAPAQLRYRAPGDTAVKIIRVGLLNKSPAVDDLTTQQLADFVLVARGSAPAASDEILVGGLPARRALLRFAIPRHIIDSTNVIRATLTLQQRPVPAFAGDDTVAVFVNLLTAGSAVTDISRQLAFVSPLSSFRPSFAPLQFASDSVRITSSNSGPVSLDIAGVLQFWRASGETALQRSIVLRAHGESSLPTEFRFYSSEAAPALRPKLRITYVPGRVVGLP